LKSYNSSIFQDEKSRKTEQDSRTLYIRFPDKQPQTSEEIKELHSDIKFVRTPRLTSKQQQKAGIANTICYAFIEFGDIEECKAAKDILATTQFKGSEVYVDFVGENSKAKQIAKTRLFVSGLAPEVDKSSLQEMFPKACSSFIPPRSKKRCTSYGFVQFSTPADAKAAFDAAQDMTIASHKITVILAKMTDSKADVQMKKAEKRKANTEDEDEDNTEDKKENFLIMDVDEDGDGKVGNGCNFVIKKEKIDVKEENLTEIKKSEMDDVVKEDVMVAEKNEEDKDKADEDIENGSEGEENVQVGG
jgi:RNA recognition motif-containing protein